LRQKEPTIARRLGTKVQDGLYLTATTKKRHVQTLATGPRPFGRSEVFSREQLSPQSVTAKRKDEAGDDSPASSEKAVVTG